MRNRLKKWAGILEQLAIDGRSIVSSFISTEKTYIDNTVTMSPYNEVIKLKGPMYSEIFA